MMLNNDQVEIEVPEQQLPEIAKYSKRPVLRTAGQPFKRDCVTSLSHNGGMGSGVLRSSQRFDENSFNQSNTVFQQDREGQFMYTTLRQKQHSSERIEQITNRIQHLQRQEKQIQRNYKIHKNQKRRLESHMADYRNDQLGMQQRLDLQRQIEAHRMSVVSQRREHEKQRQDPRVSLRMSREREAYHQRQESIQQKAEQVFAKEQFLEKMHHRINSMKVRETQGDKRLRKSVQVKTQYLVRISQEQQILQKQDHMIKRLEDLQVQTAMRVREKSIKIYNKIQTNPNGRTGVSLQSLTEPATSIYTPVPLYAQKTYKGQQDQIGGGTTQQISQIQEEISREQDASLIETKGSLDCMLGSANQILEVKQGQEDQIVEQDLNHQGTLKSNKQLTGSEATCSGSQGTSSHNQQSQTSKRGEQTGGELGHSSSHVQSAQCHRTAAPAQEAHPTPLIFQITNDQPHARQHDTAKVILNNSTKHDQSAKEEPVIAKVDQDGQIELYDEHYSSARGTPQQITLRQQTPVDGESPRNEKLMVKNASSPSAPHVDYDRAQMIPTAQELISTQHLPTAQPVPLFTDNAQLDITKFSRQVLQEFPVSSDSNNQQQDYQNERTYSERYSQEDTAPAHIQTDENATDSHLGGMTSEMTKEAIVPGNVRMQHQMLTGQSESEAKILYHDQTTSSNKTDSQVINTDDDC